jgi:hypothetical protein
MYFQSAIKKEFVLSIVNFHEINKKDLINNKINSFN